MNKFILLLFIALMFCAPLTATVQANETVTYQFDCVTTPNTRTVDMEIGEAQLFVDVIDHETIVTIDGVDHYQVRFTFRNEGLDLASIGAIYFDDGTLFAMTSIHDSSGVVSFTLGSASPPELPDPLETLDPEFVVSAGFLCDSDPPTIDNGVNPYEWISILFTLQENKTFADTIAALNNGADYDDSTDDLRIGLFVTGIGLLGSPSSTLGQECFVNTIIPAPSAIVLGSMGMGIVGWLRRRRTL